MRANRPVGRCVFVCVCVSAQHRSATNTHTQQCYYKIKAKKSCIIVIAFVQRMIEAVLSFSFSFFCGFGYVFLFCYVYLHRSLMCYM